MNQNPNTKEKLNIILNNYRVFGVIHTVKNLIAYLFMDGISDDFDRKYGVSTYDVAKPSASEISDEFSRINAIGYVPVREEVIRHILKISEKRIKPDDFTFVDLGCGKGRALIAASWLSFKRVVGVELSPGHTELAKKNIEVYLSSKKSNELTKCRDIVALCDNAIDFDLPDSNLLIYMYRPFKEPVFRAVLDKLSKFQRTTGKQILVAYCCPMEEFLLEEHQNFFKREEYQVISEEYSWSLWECR